MTGFARRAGVVTAAVVALALAVAGIAGAVGQARSASPAVAVGPTHSWGVAAADTAGNVYSGTAISVSWPAVSGTTPFYFTVKNTGTLALTGQRYLVQQTAGIALEFRLEACLSGTWNANNGNCPGNTVLVLGSTANGTTPPNVTNAMAVGALISVRLRPLILQAGSVVRVQPQASTDNVRDGVTTHS